MMKTAKIVQLILYFFFLWGVASSQESQKWPDYWEIPTHLSEKPAPDHSIGLFRSSALVWIRIYQTVIASQDLPSCVFHPSCSRFAFDAIKQYGAIKGILLSTDRLMRCNPFAYKYYQFDGSKFADPVLKYQIPDKNAQPTNLKK